MKTINTILTQLTDADILLAKVKESLAAIDPHFSKEEEAYRRAADLLEQEVPSAWEYLVARKQELASDLIYAGWLGFQWNLDCFRDPVHKLMLNEDFEELHMENRMPTLPMAQAAQHKIDAFLPMLPQDKRYLTDPITDYYAYLKTYAYKLAHYAGFCFAEAYLSYVIPGYTGDPALTLRYSQKIGAFLGTGFEKL